MTSTGNRFIHSVLKFSVGSWLSAGIALMSVPIVTRFFTPEEFGRINMFTMAVAIIVAVVGLSMEQSYVRYFKEVKSEKEQNILLTQCFFSVLVCYSLFLLFLLCRGQWFSFYLFDELNYGVIYIALPLMVLLSIIGSYQAFYFRMNEKALGFTVISLLTVIANRVAMVGASFYNPNYVTGIFLTVFAVFILVLGCFLFYRKSFNVRFKYINIHRLLPLLKYAIPLVPVGILTLLNTFVVRYFLKDFVSYEALGIFVAAFSIANIITIIQTGFNVYWVPFMLANYQKEQQLIKKIHSAISFIMVFSALCIVMFSDVLFVILGDAYRSGKNIFAFLLVYPVVYTISETTSCGISLSKKTYLHTYCTVISFILSVLFAYLLIPKYGILGASISNVISGVTFFMVRTYYGQKEYRSTEKIYRTFIAIFLLILSAYINYKIYSVLYRNLLITLFFLVLMLMYSDILSQIKKIFNQKKWQS